MTLDDTIEIETAPLLQHIFFMAREIGEWETYIPENIANEDHPWDEVNPSNVTSIDYDGDGEIDVSGRFNTRVITDRIRGTRVQPPEVVTAEVDGFFHIRYSFEDGGWTEGLIEVV